MNSMINGKTIKEFPSYTIFSDGKVFSEKRNRYLKPSLNNSGYQTVSLTDSNAKCKPRSVHSLVALAYLGEPEGLEIDHIDNDPTNNDVKNLRYVTESENNARKYENKKRFVCFSEGKYIVTIKVNRKTKNLGRFDNEQDAYSAAFDFYTKTFGKEPWSKND